MNTVINLYQMFQQMGFSESKIHTLVKTSCRGKKDLESIFLSSSQHSYLRSVDETYTRVKKLVLMVQERQAEDLVNDINDFRRIL